MTPFLVEILEELLCGFYSKFIWPYILANAKTTTFLLKIDVSNRTNQLSTSKINVSFLLKYDLQQLKSKEKMFRSTSSREEYMISLSQCALISLRRVLCHHWLLAVWSVSHPHLWLNSQKSVNIFLTNCW